MLTRTDLRGSTPTLSQLRRALPRGGTDVNAVLDTVTPVVEAIAEHGVPAALDYTEKFDRVRPASVRVPAEVIAQAREHLLEHRVHRPSSRSMVCAQAARMR